MPTDTRLVVFAARRKAANLAMVVLREQPFDMGVSQDEALPLHTPNSPDETCPWSGSLHGFVAAVAIFNVLTALKRQRFPHKDSASQGAVFCGCAEPIRTPANSGLA